jgi:hypothetical protein
MASIIENAGEPFRKLNWWMSIKWWAAKRGKNNDRLLPLRLVSLRMKIFSSDLVAGFTIPGRASAFPL